MNSHSPTKFPWLRFLLDNLLWAMIVMLLLGVLIWAFGGNNLSEQFENYSPFWQLVRNLLTDATFALFTLVPSFYAGMGACVWLEKHKGKYQQQFETAFSVVYYVVFLVFVAIYGFWIYQGYQGEETNWATLFNPLRLLIVGYIFHGNVVDNLWEEVFEKRD